MFFNNKFHKGKYSELDPKHILSTLEKLQLRIEEQFPDSGLGKVSLEMKEVAQAIVDFVQKLPRPFWIIRILTFLAITLVIGLAVWLCTLTVRFIPAGESGLMEVLQGAESATNELIFLSLAILFLATLENRIKRQASLRSLHRLRSIAHVVDMHQLTKDPAGISGEILTTKYPVKRVMSAQELTRYLDFCSELLAINSKLAALHVQYFQDSEVLKTVNEVEMLAHELSNKIWQKIMILDVMKLGEGEGEGESEGE
ncbi:MAG TPA: hypothetical protein PKA00_19650 [Saprospiraceae bacterium]|nr:hypothetical protein [Saprospiraceae bacterium]HMQ85135.1 hypothetical protein [Saprospiraceae bacterium]